MGSTELASIFSQRVSEELIIGLIERIHAAADTLTAAVGSPDTTPSAPLGT